jgi:arylsulfatase A-like enzyme
MTAPKTRPNVLFFLTDDQRFDTLRALGNKQIHTPHLDALVASGTTFTHAHIPGGSHGAVCMPSRAMLHTGRTLHHLEGEGQSIPDNHTTMGECFRAAGYETFGTGKWHNGRASYARSFSCGDEIFFGGMSDHWNVPAYRFDPAGRYETKCPATKDAWHSNELEFRECDHVHAGLHSTDLFVDTAIEYVRGRDRSRPFFAYVSLMAPHDPRTMPERFRALYDPDALPLPENFLAGHPIDTGHLRGRDETLAGFPRDPAEIRRHIAEYYAMITHLDEGLGRLLATLQDQGELENTIIAFTGDNGLALGQHGLMGKQSSYDHSVRVPLIFSGPGIPRGERRDALVYLLDIFPTLCEMTGIDIPASVEGCSLAPCVMTAGRTVRNRLYLAFEKTVRGVTDGQWKLIEYACGATQLFHLAEDPLEMHNLAEHGDQAGTVRKLRVELLRMRDEWEDAKHPTGAAFWSRRPDLATA